MNRWLTNGRRVLKKSPYILTFAATVVVGFISLPVALVHLGVQVWTGIAIGQAIGVYGAVLTAYGYGVFGPVHMARISPADQVQYYGDSLIVRTTCFVSATGLAIPLALVLGGKNGGICAISALCGCLAGLNANWAYIGQSKPLTMFVTDAVPRLGAVVLSLIFVVMGATATTFIVTQLVGVLLSVTLGSIIMLRPWERGWKRRTASEYRREFVAQTPAGLMGLMAVIYVGLPVIAVAWLSPLNSAVYTLGDKLLRFSSAGLSIVAQVEQGWVPRAPENYRHVRALRAFKVSAVAGALGAVVIAFLGPLVSSVLSSGQVTVPREVAAPMALSFMLVALTQSSGLVILPTFGWKSIVVRSTVIAAVVGVPAICAGAFLFGAEGAAWGLVIAESLVLVVQGSALRRSLRGEVSLARYIEIEAAREKGSP